MPYPDGFNLWENQSRLDWLAQHGLKAGPMPKFKGSPEYDRAMREAEERRTQELDEELWKEPEAYRPPWARDGSSEPWEEKKPASKYFPAPCVDCGMDEGYGGSGLCGKCRDAAYRKERQRTGSLNCCPTCGRRLATRDGRTYCACAKDASHG